MKTVQGQYNKKAKCPYCGEGADGATGDRVPKEGDIVICFYCAEVGVYTEDLLIRRATFKEHQEFKVDDEVQRYQKAIRKSPLYKGK